MKELGKILKDKREEQGLDLDKVHRATKIQEKYISAIEDGDETVFSAEIYYKSFVKSYARYLGLNGDDLLAQYEKRKNESEGNEDGGGSAKNEKNKNGFISKKPKAKSAKESGGDLKKLFITVFIALVLCAAFLYMNKNISAFTEENPDRIPAIEQKKMQIQKMQELREQRERELKERNMPVEISAESNKKDTENGANEALKPFPQKHEQIVAQPAPKSESAAIRNVNEIQTAAVPAVKQQNDKQELEIIAIENVWIRVEGDGREFFQGTIVKGTKKTWKANDEFNVKIGYTPGVDVFFNGIKIDVDAGAVQDVNTVVLKRQS
ncbi:MAG: DUF4115 domain-containing protein [Endomicrobia bacterium]|nr:DUF4115 domain-containing protein [Endomicrobiia bacterium]